MNDAAIADLPDDPILLKQMIAQRNSALEHCDVHIEQLRQAAAAALAQVAQRDAAIEQRDSQIEQIKREAAETIEAMTQRHKAELDAILRRFYGPHSESFDPRQILLFGLTAAPDGPVDPNSDEAKAAEAETGQKLTSRRINHHKHGRRELPASLPRREILHDLTDEQKPCPCCGKNRVCIGSETSEQLEYIPAKFEVLKHIRPKYACKTCGEGCVHCDGSPQIEIVPVLPGRGPIEKGLPGPGLLAHIITSKLNEHTPLYRLEKRFDHLGVDLARSTMCVWMMNCGNLVQPLIDLMTRRVKLSRAIHTDDTRVPVQDDNVKGKCKSGRIWCYLGDDGNPYVLFHYTPDRTRAGPQNFLADYQGYLQADAYGGYDGIYTRGNVTEVACWAHARRKFFDAKDTDGRRATEMLAMVAELYAIENEAKEKIAGLTKQQADLSRDERDRIRLELRQEKSAPALAKIKTWLDAEQKLVLPRSPMAAAITYMLNQWIALSVYVTAGFLNIDNNAAERALKRVAIGRKNWLFAGNDAAGKSHANLYTLLASAERHGLDPQKYTMSVLAKIGQTPLSGLEQFLPDQWKADDAAENPVKKASSAEDRPSPS
jgi:transposase